ncbi:MAG: hypothetical protein ACREOW_12005 [Thermodesulfobacteriota bacterium]
MKKSLFAIILLGLGLILGSLIGEGTLTAYHYFKHHTLSRAELISIRENMLQKTLGPTISPDPNRGWENELIIHPFFGYVNNSKLPGVNNFGFSSKYNIGISDSGYSLANGRRDDLLVVGIFGGSFAEATGVYGQYYLEKKLMTLFPEKVPVVLNFGMGGHALPQSAFIFIYFKELFDIVVFIDGVNEVWNVVGNNKAGYPPEYAKAHHFKYKLSLNELSPERFILTSRIISMKGNLASVTKISLLPIIRQSLFVHHIWWAFARHWDYQISLKSLEIEKSYEQGPKFFNVDDEFIIDHAVRQWKKYHQLIHEISSSSGILDIHLLQPNPFVEKSKSLTSDEVHKIYRTLPPLLRNSVIAGYPKLRLVVSSLKKSGLVAEDLSYIYKDIKESIWVDASHANRIGYEIVLDKVFEMIRKNKSLLVQYSNKRREK